MFMAAEAGRYHFASGQDPHLIKDCTEQCQPGAVFTAMVGSMVHVADSGAAVAIPMDTMTIPWNLE